MPMDTIEQVAGTDREVILTLRDRNGDAVNLYANDDTLGGKIWSGDDFGVLAVPQLGWLDDDASTGQVRMLIRGEDVAALVPAVYRILCTVTRASTGVAKPFLQAYLRIKPAPGVAPDLRVYGAYQDLTTLVPKLMDLQSDESVAGLMEERAGASRWLDNVILSRCRGECERSQVAGYLAASKLVVDEDVRNVVAWKALSTALQGRLATQGDADPYPTLGRRYERQAINQVAAMVARIDVNGDGTYLMPINLAAFRTSRG